MQESKLFMPTDANNVVLYNTTPIQFAVAARRAERYNLAVDGSKTAEEMLKKARSKDCGVLLLGNFQPESHKAARLLRKDKSLKKLPIFAVIADQDIKGKTLALANTLQVELLPAS